MRGAATAALLLVLLTAPAAARAQTAGSTGTVVDPAVLTAPSSTERPPVGWRLTARRVVGLAEAAPRIAAVRSERPGSYSRAFLKGDRRWQVSTYDRRPGSDEEIGQALVDDRTGRVLEAWTGIQVAWSMARGYPGAFGRRANAPWVWIGLLVLFVLPFLRPPFRALHVDLLVVASLSISYAVFNRADVDLSVPLTYPPLLYLLGRMLWLARARGRAGAAIARPALRLLVGTGFLTLAIVFLLGFRLGLNLTASNVIDVGYAGVIGADRIGDGDALYGRFPPDNVHGDTYGPLTYYAYVPFEQALPFRGEWDDLPAAHGAAIAFDLACVLLLWLLGRRLRGPTLGLLLAYLWLACPFTLMVANSNANDALLGAFVLLALLVAGRPVVRGAAVAAAGLTKFAPLALAPLLATYRRPGEGAVRPFVLTTLAGLLAGAVLLTPVVLLDGGLDRFWERTLGFQAGRDSPFSVWGLWGLDGPQRVVQVAGVLLALLVAIVPRRRDLVSLCALSAAVLIGLQLGMSHWFYLYVAWFVGPLLAASLGEYAEPEPRPAV